MNQLAYQITPASVNLPTQFSDLGGLISTLLQAAITIAGLATFAFLLAGGFRYLTAGGDEKATAEASKIITNAVIGLVIVFFVWWDVLILQTILGIHVIK